MIEKFNVLNRWTNAVQFTAEIETTPEMTMRVKLGLAVRWAQRNDADLRGADLRGAVLSDADLRDADLRGADLRGAVLSDADWIPKIENIHQKVYAAANIEGAFDMSSWHVGGYCGTTHCRAGHVVVLAGDAGRVLEGVYGTGAAAALIYQASDLGLEKIPNWIATNEEAMADMKRLAVLEAKP